MRSRTISIFYSLLIAAAIDGTTAFGKEPKNPNNIPSDGFPYLYAKKKNHNASFPVIEVLPPEGRKKVMNHKPDFLYKEDQGYRIVEFYGHWCGTCLTFKDHYVHFAKKVKEIASHHNQTVDVYAISCLPNTYLCRDQKAHGYPFVRLFKPGETKGFDMKHTDVNPIKVLERLGMKINIKEVDLDWEMEYIEAEKPSKVQQILQTIFGNTVDDDAVLHRRTRDELKADIHKSFDFMMRDGVFISNDPIQPDAAKALLNFLKLLYKTLPVGWELRTLINKLIKDFNYVYKHEAYMNGILDQHPPHNDGWTEACSHGKPDTGFTCGLWEMLHTMTVGVVEHNTMVHEDKRIAPADAAHTLRDFIDYFFKCEECRAHFVRMYDHCGYNHCNRLEKDATGLAKDKLISWAQLPLWLFEVHNAVNVPLTKERAERENRQIDIDDEIDALWPSQDECLPCWKVDKDTGTFAADSTNIYKWLQLEYGVRDAKSGILQKELLQAYSGIEKRKRRKQQRIKFTNSSMVAGLYATIILGIKIRQRRVTGQRKKDEGNDILSETLIDNNTKVGLRVRS